MDVHERSDYDAFDALLHHIYQETQGDAWFKPEEENLQGGVCLRVKPGQFRVFPYENRFLEPFEVAVRALNPVIAVKLRSASVNAVLLTATPSAKAIFLDGETRIQIVDTMAMLPRADKEQRGAFVRDERVLILWSDSLENMLPVYQEFEEKLIKCVWRSRPRLAQVPTSMTDLSEKSDGSTFDLNDKPPALEHDEKDAELSPTTGLPKNSMFEWKIQPNAPPPVTEKTSDVESGKKKRPVRLFAPAYNGLSVALSIFFIGSGLSLLLQEFRLDGRWDRFFLLVTAPFLFCVALFFSLQVIGNTACILGPIAHYHENSKYYSAVKPKPNPTVDSALPHITIEMPVYKESLEQTIAPSVYSLKKCMQTYARQGGTTAILVHDDGLQLISEADREARKRFYADHNIAWVARPAHDSAPDGYKRAGRFKKASNMNYGLALSLKMEKHLMRLEAAGEDDDVDGPCLEDKALEMAVEETYEESGRRFKPWASNGKSMRIGEIILIVDSDTIVPEDCLRDAARELAESPEVGIIQHESGVMQVAHHYFENGITHFTRRINKCISMVCANGEVAPFVGHNAFLRWSALQDAAFIDVADGVKKIWSESNVSEDFDMALRLQLKGYIIRWATYCNGGFEEGVSLTPDDELNRWEKYAYGCNELIFNPLSSWWRLGPINKQLRTFVWSDAPIHYKISMMAYMFSYYGLACSFLLTVLNYFLVGFQVDVDAFYLHSFEIWLACVAVFPIAGNLQFTLLEYRLGHRSFIASLAENVKWIPFFFFFFGGLSIHLSKALIAHCISFNITWGATKKEVERSNFFIEIPRILKRFWISFVLCTICVAVLVLLSLPVLPLEWRVDPVANWSIVFPLALTTGCHLLFPIVLNPWLMVFSY